MRIDSPVLPQSLLEPSKPLEKKEVTLKISKENPSLEESGEESGTSTFLSFGTRGTYSVHSLKSAVDCHVKFLSVAENNMRAVHHPPTIPSVLLAHFNGLQKEA